VRKVVEFGEKGAVLLANGSDDPLFSICSRAGAPVFEASEPTEDSVTDTRSLNRPTNQLSAQASSTAPESQVVPEAVRPLLGPSWIVEGEDPNLYEELLGRVGAAVEPRDIIDWLLVKDVVALTWQIHRSRRLQDGLVRSARRDAMERLLLIAWPESGERPDGADESYAKQLTDRWFFGAKSAKREIVNILKGTGLSTDDIAVQALSIKAEELDRLDLQNEGYEHRRDAILQQIERRRRGWSKVVKRASEEIIDAEFTETPASTNGEARTTN
jgi:hypothetical protein